MTLALPFPITMRGVIDHCVLVSLRTRARTVEHLVPRGLRLVTASDPTGGEDFAFWNVVLCHIESMRPSAAPRWMGLSYHHVAHRLLVEADVESDNGADLAQGLYFLRSDADSALIARGGNLASDFRFNPARIERAESSDAERWRVRSKNHEGDLDAMFTNAPARLTNGSPFGSLDEARSFLKYRPMGLAPNTEGSRVRLAEVFRDEREWDERPVAVESFRSGFLASIGQGNSEVEIATRVAPIAYRWRLGRSLATRRG